MGTNMEILALNVFGIEITHNGENAENASITSTMKEEGGGSFNAAADAIESMVLAHFCAGIDVTEPAYLEGIETAFLAIENNLEKLDEEPVQVTVKIIPLQPADKLSEEDRELPKGVTIVVNKDVEHKKVADAALDIFHSGTAVDCLDDFEFEVWMNGFELATDVDHDSYSLSDSGYIL